MPKNKRIIPIILLSIAILLIATNDTKMNRNIKKTINQKIIKEVEEPKINKTEELRKIYQNKDIIGNLEIEEIGINEPILQSKDNEYYLTHDNYGNYDKYGSVYLDYRCHKTSKKLLIFGHSSTKIDTPFNNLENYYEESYYKEHPIIKLTIEEETREYKIFSVYIEPTDFTYMNLKTTEEEYLNELKQYKKKSFYNTEVPIYQSDEILILQTCSNHKDYQKYKDKFLLIIAKRVS